MSIYKCKYKYIHDLNITIDDMLNKVKITHILQML